ncbi:MAG: HD domain-containing phosphohydrolase [Acidobacteriota bacterium]
MPIAGRSGALRGAVVGMTAAALLGSLASAVLMVWLGGGRLPWTVAVLSVGLLGALIYWVQRARLARIVRRVDALRRINLSTIEALTLAIDAKDPHSQGHVRRVQAYTLALARRMRVCREEFEALRTASLLHDIGKLAIPDYLLNKPGRLSHIEFQKVKAHPGVAAEILAEIDFPDQVVPIIRHHHERWDGSGYPEGLRAEEIPHGARILAVADAFDALTSDRAYRARKSHEEACALLEAWSGIHYDREVVRALREALPSVIAAGARADERPSVKALPHDEGRREAAPGPPAQGVPGASPDGGQVDAGGFGDRLHRSVASGEGPPPARPEPEGTGAPPPPPESALRDISSAQREVFALYEIAQILGSSLRLAEVLELVVSKIGQVVPYHTCAIYLMEDTGESLSARFAAGADAGQIRGRSLRLGEGITGWAALQRSVRFSSTPALDLAGVAVDPAEYSTVAAFPLCHDGRVLGVITLYFPKGVPCLDDHLRMMDIISKLSAGAVFNSTIFAQTQESALTDDLTSLPNSRYLRQAFDQETIRSQQAGQPMALLEMDLDNFKAINDRHGHQVGDRFLAQVSRVLRSNLRDRDILVRLSGDEFAAVLPLTGFGAAALLAERLQRAVDSFALKLEGGKAARSGLSVGIALYPQDGESFEDLILKADYNMYENKGARKKARLTGSPNVIPFPIRSPGGRG